jgi:hypothetical protein
LIRLSVILGRNSWPQCLPAVPDSTDHEIICPHRQARMRVDF